MHNRNKEAVRLHLVEGWTPKEICCWLGMSPATFHRVRDLAKQSGFVPEDPKVTVPAGPWA